MRCARLLLIGITVVQQLQRLKQRLLQPATNMATLPMALQQQATEAATDTMMSQLMQCPCVQPESRRLQLPA